MNVLVVGLGVIGAIHGYLFHQAGHNVEHLIREGSAKAGVEKLEVDILDGRRDPKGVAYEDIYPVQRLHLQPSLQNRFQIVQNDSVLYFSTFSNQLVPETQVNTSGIFYKVLI